MAGLTYLVPVLIAALFLLLVQRYRERRRIQLLTEKIEDFLVGGGKPLAFSVREDALAPLHNAAAELQNRVMLARELQAEECRRTNDLIADISHQLKTPLASLRLFCELDAGRHLSQELSQLERMERLIYALLRLERLYADGYTFTFAEHDAARLVSDAWAHLSPLWPDRTLTVTGNACIRCDEKWLGEAFVNLLKNACEHTAAGGTISVSMDCSDTTYFCTVEDDGGGAAAKDIPHLFERFYRAEGSSQNGAGIGLAMVKAIIGRHHGTVHAENAEKGLRVVISLPIMNLTKS